MKAGWPVGETAKIGSIVEGAIEGGIAGLLVGESVRNDVGAPVDTLGDGEIGGFVGVSKIAVQVSWDKPNVRSKST